MSSEIVCGVAYPHELRIVHGTPRRNRGKPNVLDAYFTAALADR